MGVIGHEAIRPDLDAASVAPLGHQRRVQEVVVVAEEGLLSAVSALRDVMRKIRDNGARETRHPPGIIVGSDIGIGTALRMVSPWKKDSVRPAAPALARLDEDSACRDELEVRIVPYRGDGTFRSPQAYKSDLGTGEEPRIESPSGNGSHGLRERSAGHARHHLSSRALAHAPRGGRARPGAGDVPARARSARYVSSWSEHARLARPHLAQPLHRSVPAR